MPTLGPRVVIGGVSSGVGKTTVATGLVAALARRGCTVATAKVGPDFIDPGYHSLASGRPPRNLDAWLGGADAVGPLAGRAAEGADLLVIEGVMGLFDGAVDGTPSSTADIAVLLDAPVILVVDAGAMSSSVAAIVAGFRDHDPRLTLAGVVLNRVGSPGHELLLREAIEPLGVPVLGVLGRDDRLTWRDRHLGLVPVAEQPEVVRGSLDRLAAAIDEGFDLDALVRVAAGAPPATVAPPTMPDLVGACRIGVAAGPAFTFAYQDNLDALAAAGAEIMTFDPLRDAQLPDAVDGLVVGGGFPEVHSEALSANEALRHHTARAVAAGLPVWAECGGLLWLGESLDERPMVGALPIRAHLGERLTLGYREARLLTDSPVGPPGTTLRGHEFHYSTCEPSGAALALTGRFGHTTDGFATSTLLATYLHHHAGGDPSRISAFVGTCVDRRWSTDRERVR
jgi:cobyrinic acid a,c-diamide synthase